MYKLTRLCASALLLCLITPLTAADAKADNLNFQKAENNRSVVTDRLIVTDDFLNFDATLKPKSFTQSTNLLFTTGKKVIAAPTKTEEAPAPYYPLTDRERDKIERVTMASCGDYGYDMMKSNAQVILDRLKSGKFGNSVDEVLDSPHQFETPTKGCVNENVKRAVSAVFDRGERMSDTPIYYYVNPNIAAISAETWRKGKTYVMTVGKGMFVHEYWTEK